MPLPELVATALVNKGVGLGALDRREEEIAIYDDLLARFGTATELPLRDTMRTRSSNAAFPSLMYEANLRLLKSSWP